MGIFCCCFSLVWLLSCFHLFWSEGNILLFFVVAAFLYFLLGSTAFFSPLYFSHFFHPETLAGFLEIPGTVIIIKRLPRAPIYSTWWEHRVLHNNTNNTCTHTHTHIRVLDRGIASTPWIPPASMIKHSSCEDRLDNISTAEWSSCSCLCSRCSHYSLSLICQPDIRGHEAPHHHHRCLQCCFWVIHGQVSCHTITMVLASISGCWLKRNAESVGFLLLLFCYFYSY